ncbi:hypothetical protein KXR53_28045 [Inquilinus limosus]|uniref:hypothetical protein n=1 Tax=Inquilinus limosus TaxID=171674 RepID=UPI003F154451
MFAIGGRSEALYTAADLLSYIDRTIGPSSGSSVEPHLREGALQLMRYLHATDDAGAARVGSNLRVRAVQWLEAMGARLALDDLDQLVSVAGRK